MIESLDESKSAALCFRSAEDAINYAHHLTEDSNRRFANLSLNAIERYVKGDVCLVLRVCFDWCTCECDLVFVRVPTGVSCTDQSGDKAALRLVGELERTVIVPADDCWLGGNTHVGDLSATEIEWHQGTMFLGVTELIQSPEGVIPSLVWTETPKQREDFRGQIPATSAFDNVPKSGEIVPKRELTPLRFDSSRRDGSGVAGLVKDGAEIVGGVENDARQIGRQPPHKLDFKKILSAINIVLNDFGPWLIADKLVDFGIKIVDVMLCAQDRETRTLEEIAHGRQGIRSNERP
jgi:hypothetical protein